MSTNKGSYENPYTYDEYELLLLNDEWEGGFVRFPDGIKYSTGTADVYGSSGNDGSGSDSGSDSDSDYYGSDELGSDTTNIETPGQPGDSTNTNPGRGGGGGTGGVNSGGGIPSGGGSSHSGGDEYPDIPDVLPTSDFRGLKEDDGCFKRCNEMLNLAGYELVPDISYEILMANSDSLGNATTAASSFEEGLDYIDDQLKQGIPVIVGVSYDKGKSVGDAWKDKAADHFVIIVGGSRTSGYHYFDPATANQGRGTSTDNKFTMQGNLLKDVNNCRGEGKEYEKDYTLTSIRKSIPKK